MDIFPVAKTDARRLVLVVGETSGRRQCQCSSSELITLLIR